MNRQLELNTIIQRSVGPLFRIRYLESYVIDGKKQLTYVVTIKKEIHYTFEQRNEMFNSLLINNLRNDEELVYENQYYRIHGLNYSIIYVLEGYKNQSEKIGYVENNIPKTSFIRRMGVEFAFDWLKSVNATTRELVFECMSTQEMRDKYPNPASRFVESVYLQKKKYRNSNRLIVNNQIF